MKTWHYKEYVEEKEHHEARRQEHKARGRAHGPCQNVNPIPFHSHLRVNFPTFTTRLKRSCEVTIPCRTSGGVQTTCATILPTKLQGLHL